MSDPVSKQIYGICKTKKTYKRADQKIQNDWKKIA